MVRHNSTKNSVSTAARFSPCEKSVDRYLFFCLKGESQVSRDRDTVLTIPCARA